MQKYEEDQDVLEDVIIENKQAIEMTDIYSNILASTMDFFASVISNNLNIVMKRCPFQLKWTILKQIFLFYFLHIRSIFRFVQILTKDSTS